MGVRSNSRLGDRPFKHGLNETDPPFVEVSREIGNHGGSVRAKDQMEAEHRWLAATLGLLPEQFPEPHNPLFGVIDPGDDAEALTFQDAAHLLLR